MRSYYIETYGCTLNKTDSALIEEKLINAGLHRVEKHIDADLIILNTCTVRLDTEERVLRRIKELCDPSRKLIVTGCLASAQPAYVINECKDAIILPNNLISLIKLYIDGETRGSVDVAIEEKRNNPSIYKDGPVLSVPLVDGCLDNCSYCITKLARPILLSRNPTKLILKLKDIVKSSQYDVLEIQLTGQDLAVYGYDISKKPMLPELLEHILSLELGEKLIKIRLGMMTPNWFAKIMDDILELMKHDERIYKFLHLPVQSGDDRVLRMMNRKYTVDEFKYIVKTVRDHVSDIQIATDVIVGHPGEDDIAFNNTLELIKELKIERLHIAQYTSRPHTMSARMAQIAYSVKKQRSTLLNEIYMKIGFEWHSKLLGKKLKSYVVEKFRWKNFEHIVGRTDNYVSIVIRDGVIDFLGKTIDVCIDEVTFYDARGYVC